MAEIIEIGDTDRLVTDAVRVVQEAYIYKKEIGDTEERCGGITLKLAEAIDRAWQEIGNDLFGTDDKEIESKAGKKYLTSTLTFAKRLKKRYKKEGIAEAEALFDLSDQRIRSGKGLDLSRSFYVEGDHLFVPLVAIGRLEKDKVLTEARSEARKLRAGLARVSLYRSACGDDYAGLDKVAEGMTWSLGTQGIQVSDDTYIATPLLATKLVPSLAIDKGLPRQKAFPFCIDPKGKLPLEVQTAGLMPGAISPTAAKLIVLALSGARATKGLILCSIEELTRYLLQNRPYRASLLQTTRKALLDMKRLSYIFPDGTAAAVFSDVRYPVTKDVSGEQIVGWSPGKLITGALDHGVSGGYFLINLSGVMRISGRHIQDMRLYMIAASEWNRRRASQSPPVATLDEWAISAAMLSPAAYKRVLDRSPKGRKAIYKMRKQAEASLERLHDQGLIVLDHQGKRISLSQPEAHKAAYDAARNRHKKAPK